METSWIKCESSGCVQVITRDGMVLVRDGKDAGGPELTFTQQEWAKFLTEMRDGKYDL